MLGQDFYQQVPPEADLSHIVQNLRQMAVPIEALTLDPDNARKHPDKNLEAIKGSLLKFGQRRPAVANLRSGQPILEAGNGMVQAARNLGWQYLAVLFVDDPPVVAAGYAVADNRTA